MYNYFLNFILKTNFISETFGFKSKYIITLASEHVFIHG